MKISELQKQVLTQLIALDYGYSAYFKYIAHNLNLEIRQVRLACRALKRKGLAEYNTGLFDEEGRVAGSGYAATKEGRLFINPCLKCGLFEAIFVDGECNKCFKLLTPST